MFGNVNKVILMGRLVRDPELKTFSNGGKLATITIVVNDRRKNKSTGDWEDHPAFIDCKIFNRGEFGKQADRVQEYYRKGSLAYVEGKLEVETWETDGQKRSKTYVYVDNFQVIESQKERSSNQSNNQPEEEYIPDDIHAPTSVPDDDIPF